jgi:hypothetical protein
VFFGAQRKVDMDFADRLAHQLLAAAAGGAALRFIAIRHPRGLAVENDDELAGPVQQRV